MVRERIEERLARRGGAIELLHAPAFLFGLGADLRSALYDRGWLRPARVDATVVSVGNLTAGGTGKTPMAIWLARELVRRKRRVGVLSRGFGAPVDGAPGGANDEAILFARALPELLHLTDPDRVRGALELASRGCDTLVCDDAFQHRRLARDLDLVLIDATRPWGLPARGGPPVRALLPRGLLRERPAALRRAQATVITRSDLVEPDALERLVTELDSAAPGLPLAQAIHRPTRLVDELGASEPLGNLRGATVELASGLGNPDAFHATVARLGACIQSHVVRPDHHAWTRAEARALATHGARAIVPLKDAVKLWPLGARVMALEVEVELTAGASVIQALLDSLPSTDSAVRRAALHEGLHG